MIDNFWENIKKTLDYKKMDSFISEERKNATLNKGIMLFVVAVVLASVVSFVMSLASAHMMDGTIETLSEKYQVANITGKILNESYITKAAITFLLVSIPMSFIVVFLVQKAMYFVMKKLKGQGKFEEQYYMMAFPAVTQSVSSIGLVFLLAPCINIVALFGFVALSLYLIFFVQGKILKELHKTSWPMAIAVIIAGNILSAAIFFGVMQLVTYIGLYPTLPQQLDVQLGG